MDYIKQLQEHLTTLLSRSLTQRDIARRAGVDPMTVNKILKGRQKTVTVETYAKIMGVVPGQPRP